MLEQSILICMYISCLFVNLSTLREQRAVELKVRVEGVLSIVWCTESLVAASYRSLGYVANATHLLYILLHNHHNLLCNGYTQLCRTSKVISIPIINLM